MAAAKHTVLAPGCRRPMVLSLRAYPPAMRSIGLRIAASLALAATLAACGGGNTAPSQPGGSTSGPDSGNGGLPTGVPVTDESKLCDLLGPGDFQAAGIEGTSAPTVNSDEPGAAYCLYTGAPAGQGGVELDVFVDDDPAGTYDTILSETSSVADTEIAGADAAASGDGIAGAADQPASVVVRKGKLVFTIAAPGGPNNSVILEQLAALVLARGAGLAG